MTPNSVCIFFCSLSLFSCTHSDKTKDENKVIVDSSFKLTKEIPTYGDGRFDLFYLIAEKRGKDLHLDDPFKINDSIQIRIWYEPSLSPKKELVLLKYKNGTWLGDHYSITVEERVRELDTVIAYKKKSLIPMSSWDNLISSLLDLKILTLPNMFNIPGLIDNSTDGTFINVEIVTKNNYRFYSYKSIYSFKDKYWQVENMDLIINILKSEFNLEW